MAWNARADAQESLSYRATYLKVPARMQRLVERNLDLHRETIYGPDPTKASAGLGAGGPSHGYAGTTGANFLAGNVGFGQAGKSRNLMSLVFGADEE